MTLFARILSTFEDALTGGDVPQVGQYAVKCPAKWMPKKAASVEVPKKEKKRVKIDIDPEIYTDEEILEMSDAEFAIKVGGARNRAEFYNRRDADSAAKKQPQTTFDFEADNLEEYGITDAEYGQLLAYDPPLLDLELASKVKMAIVKGETLTKFAERIGVKYQLVRHYSAALKRAKK